MYVGGIGSKSQFIAINQSINQHLSFFLIKVLKSSQVASQVTQVKSNNLIISALPLTVPQVAKKKTPLQNNNNYKYIYLYAYIYNLYIYIYVRTYLPTYVFTHVLWLYATHIPPGKNSQRINKKIKITANFT